MYLKRACGILLPQKKKKRNLTFGEFIREKRLKAELTLRKFCEIAEVDPSNWSKIERDLLPVSYDRKKLEKIAEIVKVKKRSKDWLEYFDLASLSQQKIPDDLYSDEEVLKILPVFFRTMREKKPIKEDLKSLFEMLKRR